MTYFNWKYQRFKGLSHKPLLTCAMLVSVLFLQGCGSFIPPIFGSGKTEMEKRTERAAAIINGEQVEPLAQASNSVSNKNIFGKTLRSDGQRLDRLERAVQDIRNDFDSVEPSIRRLMAIESDIQELTDELRRLSREPELMAPAPAPAMQPIKPAPVMQKAQAPKAAPAKSSFRTKSAPPVQSGIASIFDVRTGEHPGKTRLVLDTNANVNYSVDIDNNENLMIVDLPATSWDAPKSRSFPKSKTVASYSIESSGNSNLMIIQLKRDARISYQKSLPANKGIGRRIVLDISPQ
ncbi:MAG: AMIN domain-containing protein [Pseudomonadota bacterium]